MQEINRREFSQGSIATAIGYSRILGANERIRTGIIGAGGRGKFLIGVFKEVGAEVAAVCDIYDVNLALGLKAASTGARGYDDHRRLLEDKSIDAVFIATPDHSHSPLAIDAVEAGKDVYVEKPMSMNIEHGYGLIEATRRTKRVVQVGTQRRSFDLFLEACQILRSGATGPIRLVNSWWLNSSPPSIRSRPFVGKVDWKKWLGTAPKRPFDPKLFDEWNWFWDYSGGLIVGQGVHILDTIHWFMNSAVPVSATCTGKVGIQGAEAAETACLTVEYPDYLAVFTLGYKAMRYTSMNDQMVQYHGTKARLDTGRESYALYPQNLESHDMKPSAESRRPGKFTFAVQAHVQNFLECIRSRKDPNAPVEAGQAASIVMCMARDALRTGKRIRWNPALKRIEA